MRMSKTRVRALGAAGIAMMALASPALADDERKFDYSWTITGASDYLFRGFSLTQNDPTINSYLEFTYGIAYLGFWTSNIDTGSEEGDNGPWEQDIYLGIRPETGPISWDVGVLWYLYGVKGSCDLCGVFDTDYIELMASASAEPVKNLSVGVTGYYVPDQGYATPANYTIEGQVGYTLPEVGIFTPKISGAYGYWHYDTNSDNPDPGFQDDDGTFHDAARYWNAGLELAVEKFTFDFRYWDTSIDSSTSDERFLFTASVALP